MTRLPSPPAPSSGAFPHSSTGVGIPSDRQGLSTNHKQEMHPGFHGLNQSDHPPKPLNQIGKVPILLRSPLS